MVLVDLLHDCVKIVIFFCGVGVGVGVGGGEGEERNK